MFKYETEIVEIKTSDAVSGELGPLKYLSGLTGIPMDRIINYLLLTIIFVFDPLAIALVVAANFAFEQIRPKTKENLYGEIVEVKEDLLFEDDVESPISDTEDYFEDDELRLKEDWVEEGYMKDEASISQQAKYTDWEDEVKEDSIDKEKLKEYQEKYPNIVNVIEDF